MYNKVTFLFLIIIIKLSLFSCVEGKHKTSNSIKETTKPNILFAIMDDATYQHFGAYGCEWINTPNFDRVAREGILFNRAYTPNAKCAPSRAALLTGRNSWQLEEAANHICYFPIKFKSYAETLEENGYHVGHTGKGWSPGVAEDSEGNQRFLSGKPYDEHLTTPPTNQMSTNDYAGNFLSFLEDNKEDKPFCFWFGASEPHRGYEEGSGIKKGGKQLSQIDSVYSFFPNTDIIKSDFLDYAFEIEYFDIQLGKMLKSLEERGELNNTIIVVTSDNGMPFPRIKGQEYELSNHMPLAVMWKDGINNPNRVVNNLVSFIDIAPTFLDLAGVNPERSGMEEITGESLVPIFKSNTSGIADTLRNDYVLIGKERHDIGRPYDWGYPIRGIIKGDYLFLQNFEPTRWPAGNPITGYLNCDGGPTKTEILNLRENPKTFQYWNMSFGKRPKYELYNITQDRECMLNLIDESAFVTIAENLKHLMVRELEKQSDPRILGNGDIFDSYKFAFPFGVNFYENYLKGEVSKPGWVNPSDFEKSDLE